MEVIQYVYTTNERTIQCVLSFVVLTIVSCFRGGSLTR